MRRRYVYRQDAETGEVMAIEVGRDFQSTPERSGNTFMVDRWLEGSRTMDGVDIGSRAKLNAYMKATGVAHAGDYTQHWAKAESERAAVRSGVAPVSRELKHEVGRVAYELKNRRGRT